MIHKKLRVGVVGCGNICGIYLSNAKRLSRLEVVACADLDLERARTRAREHGVARAVSTKDLLADPRVECVLNLTTPRAHFELAMEAVRAGKHVYNEKPMCIRRAEAKELLAEAAKYGVRVGCAPDTFLGAGLQTCRDRIDEGAIGRPVAATANMTCHGHESWHPDPAFYYQAGGGPMLDMGPYYLTALIALMGPVKRVRGMANVTFAERTISSEPRKGQNITVEVPTHVVGLLDFTDGAVGAITTSFDVWASQSPTLEVHGTEGSMSLPDPNGFGGPVRLFKPGGQGWQDSPVTRSYGENWRALGLADMADAIATGRKHRASGELAMHVLDVMESIHDAATSGGTVELTTTCERPAALAADWAG
ncbi:MAG: Gfo/Idh/MocA family oxidoreductase [Phycisphaerales bacterium]|nr:Gfo/Idh/MocA family oxidoreductase [Phycisphaerales bacterium]